MDKNKSVKWTYEACYNAAKECKSKTDFKKKYEYACEKAVRKGWIKDYTWFFNQKNQEIKWTYEACYEAAKQCRSKTHFKKLYSYACEKSEKYGWIDEYTWFKGQEVKWTYDKCKELSKSFKTRTEFKKNYPQAYDKCRCKGWLNDFVWLEKYVQEIKWTKEACYKSASKCGNITEFRETYNGAYNRAVKNGWINDYEWFKFGKRNLYKKNYIVYAYEDIINRCVYIGLTNNIKRRIMEHKKKDYKHSFRTYDRVREYFEEHHIEMPEPIILIDSINAFEAQKYEGSFIEEYKNNGWNILNIAKAGSNVSSLGAIRCNWDKESCIQVVSYCKTLKELKKHFSEVYYAITTNKWNDILDKYKTVHPSEEDCFNAASSCTFKKDFRTKYPVEYRYAATVYYTLKTYTWLKGCKKTISNDECIEAAKKCLFKCEFKKKYPKEYETARQNGILNTFTWLKRKSKFDNVPL